MQEILNAVAWTFIHSLWQGLVAALLAAVIISITGNSPARIRYNLLCGLLLLFIATTCISFFTILEQQKEMASSTSQVNSGFISSRLIDTGIISEGFLVTLTQWINRNTGLLFTVWTIFFLLNSLKLLTGLAAVHRLRHYRTHPINEGWTAKLDQLRKKLAIRQSIVFLQSELVKVPVALGFLKPIILLPVGLINHLPPEQIEAILLHELGHIKRRDYFINFLQRFVEAIFFFNPAMLWVSSLIRQEREACCDDIVLATSREKHHYINALVSFQEYAMKQDTYALGFCSNKQYLLNRVKRIVMNENKKLNLFEKVALLSGILILSAFTYVTQEKTVIENGRSLLLEQATTIPISVDHQLTEIPPKQPGRLTVQTIPGYKDTLPPKKIKVKQIKNKKKVSNLTDIKNKPGKSDKKLLEIISLKEEIGRKKEIIGKKKAELTNNEGRYKDVLNKQIEKERGEIETKRVELNKKRVEWENLKKVEPGNKKFKVKPRVEARYENRRTVKFLDVKTIKKFESKHKYRTKIAPNEKKVKKPLPLNAVPPYRDKEKSPKPTSKALI